MNKVIAFLFQDGPISSGDSPADQKATGTLALKFDYTRDQCRGSDLHSVKPHSVDQEVIMDFQDIDLTKDITDITSDFLALPSKLSGRSSPSVLHRLNQLLSPDYRPGDQSKQDSKCRQRSNSDSGLKNQSCYSCRLGHRYSYDSRLDYYSSHCTSWPFSCSNKRSLNCSSRHNNIKSAENFQGISSVSIVIDDHDQEIQTMDELPTSIPDILIGNNDDEANVDGDEENVDGDDETALGAQGNWISLEAKNKALLSPRSSNGSICSYRSSNADSAIEMLTPEEEMSEMHDFSHHSSESWDSDLTSSKSESISSSSQEFGFEKSQLSDVWRQVMFCKSKSSHSKLCNVQTQLSSASRCDSVSQARLVQPPSVIVSDFSSISREDKGSQTEGESSLQDQLDLIDKTFLSFHRSQSSSSISSTDTSLSVHSDLSQDVDDMQDRASSSQTKVRGF